MLETIRNNYNFDKISIEPIHSHVYLLYASGKQYVIKSVNNTDQEKMMKYIETLNLKTVIHIVKTIHNSYYVSYNERFLYIYEYLQQDEMVNNRTKLKCYVDLIAAMHKQSFFYESITDDRIEAIYRELSEMIHQRMQDYEALMKTFELTKYKSPSGWMMILNYYRIIATLHRSAHYLSLFKDELKKCKEMRLCLVYCHFKYEHIFIRERKLISIEGLKIESCIEDIVHLYHTMNLSYEDFFIVLKYYIQKIKMQKEEKLLLASKLCLVPLLCFQEREAKNVIQMNQLLEYLRGIEKLIEKLDIDENNEIC